VLAFEDKMMGTVLFEPKDAKSDKKCFEAIWIMDKD
jgi:hypothetical protein